MDCFRFNCLTSNETLSIKEFLEIPQEIARNYDGLIVDELRSMTNCLNVKC